MGKGRSGLYHQLNCSLSLGTSVAAGKSKMASETGSVTLNRALSVSKYQCPHLYKGVGEANICSKLLFSQTWGSDSAPHTDNKGVGAAEAHSRQTDGLQDPVGPAPCVELAHWLHSAKGQRGWRRTIPYWCSQDPDGGLKDNSHLPPPPTHTPVYPLPSHLPLIPHPHKFFLHPTYPFNT